MSCKEEDSYRLSINYLGIDYEIEVPDLQTASLLLNDEGAAINYMKNLLKETSVEPTAQHLVHSSIQNNASNRMNCTPLEPHPPQLDMVWVRKKPTERDIEATQLLLSLRQKYDKQFNDKKSRKSKLWNDIYKILEENEFHLGDNGSERCRQKFANLQKSYMAYIRHQKTTGSEKTEDIPLFFDEMHSILGSKLKTNPALLEDSFNDVPENDQESHCDEELSENGTPNVNDIDDNALRNTPSTSSTLRQSSDLASTSSESIDRFRNIRTKVKPSKQDEILNELKEERKCRAKQFDILQKHLTKSEEQRDRFLDILDKAFRKKKRQREESSESE